MRLLSLSALAALALPVPAQAQPCSGTLTLATQAEVDAFACDTLAGNLSIEGEDIVSLAGLSELGAITGLLAIMDNPLLPSLDGLDALASVGGELSIFTNAALTDVSGLGSLTTVGGYFGISDNPLLPDLDGLGALASVGQALTITGNDALAGVDGLSGLTTVDLYVRISGNPSLTDVDGLNGLATVGGAVELSENGSLEHVNGLAALTTVGGELNVSSNPMLTDVNGLSALTTVGGALTLVSNASLTNVDGLAALTAVGDGSRGVLFSFNPVLVRCAVGLGPLLTLDRGGDGSAIDGTTSFLRNGDGLDPNPSDCNSEADILAAYTPTAAEDLPAPDPGAALVVFPNPAAAAVTFRFTLPRPSAATLAVYDALGREVLHVVDGPVSGVESASADLSALPAGLYVARLTAGADVKTVRFTVAR